MDMEIAKALEAAIEGLKGEDFEDFELLVDVVDMRFVWVSEQVARLSGLTVSEMIGKEMFQVNQMPEAELRAILADLRKGSRVRMPLTTKGGKTKNIDMDFRLIHLGRERPYLVAKVADSI